jgi:hypothetical protein
MTATTESNIKQQSEKWYSPILLNILYFCINVGIIRFNKGAEIYRKYAFPKVK